MSKVKNYAMTLDEIIEAGEELVASYKKTASTAEIILNAVKELKELFSSAAPAAIPQQAPVTKEPTPVPKSEPAPAAEAKTYSFQEVRGIMAGLSGKGKKAEAKNLLQKYGASRLSEIKPEDYAALVADAEVIANA